MLHDLEKSWNFERVATIFLVAPVSKSCLNLRIDFFIKKNNIIISEF